jgi:GNAT superfamily N-acetyltransferase
MHGPLTETQIPDAARAMARAFHYEPFHAYVVPDEADRPAIFTTMFEALLTFGVMFGEVLATDDLAGVAIWTPPGVDVTQERAQAAGFNRIFEALGPERIPRFGALIEYVQPTEERPELFYLMAIGVVPERKRQGIGRALMLELMQRADDKGMAIYLDTFDAENVPFYESLGFRAVRDDVEPTSGLRFWTFARD